MYQLSDKILSFYRHTQESERLTANAKGQLEFVRTQEIITRYLPAPPAVILDIGGGSGPYACWLAQAGYVEAEPSILGMSAHILAIGAK